MWFALTTLLSLITLPFSFAAISSIYWPVASPSKDLPWVKGQKNILAWSTGGGTGIDSFDIQLHNHNKTIMVGFIPIALRVPMERLPSGKKNFGGEMEVDLNNNMPTGEGFSLVFMNTFHGQVYAKSGTFTIFDSAPANQSTANLPTATVTATLHDLPNPTIEWAVTLNGIDPDATKAVTGGLAGNAGSGTG